MTTILRTAAAAGAPVAAAADAVVGAFPGAARRQRSSLRHTAHRPYPLSPRPWVMGQTWENLLFAHWPVGADQIRDLVPRALDLDLFDGSAWLSVTPFQVRGTRPRGALPPPVLSSFPELNVRTYVTLAGRPGIWFFSLDAGSAAAVVAARLLYRLPYFHARMRAAPGEDWIDYRSRRADSSGAPADFVGRYRPTGGIRPPPDGPPGAWLVERYRLYTVDRSGRVLVGEIHHRPWTLQDADAEIETNTMAAPLGLELSGAPLLQFARRQDVVFWPPLEVAPPAACHARRDRHRRRPERPARRQRARRPRLGGARRRGGAGGGGRGAQRAAHRPRRLRPRRLQRLLSVRGGLARVPRARPRGPRAAVVPRPARRRPPRFGRHVRRPLAPPGGDDGLARRARAGRRRGVAAPVRDVGARRRARPRRPRHAVSARARRGADRARTGHRRPPPRAAARPADAPAGRGGVPRRRRAPARRQRRARRP